jgi:hypothetical protein
MDTTEIVYSSTKYCLAHRVYREGKFLYAYDYWFGDYKMLGSKGQDIASFKVKEVKGL